MDDIRNDPDTSDDNVHYPENNLSVFRNTTIQRSSRCHEQSNSGCINN